LTPVYSRLTNASADEDRGRISNGRASAAVRGAPRLGHLPVRRLERRPPIGIYTQKGATVSRCARREGADYLGPLGYSGDALPEQVLPHTSIVILRSLPSAPCSIVPAEFTIQSMPLERLLRAERGGKLWVDSLG